MRRGFLTFVCVALLIWDAVAQDQADRAKYELIRETINFLATDKAVSQDTNFRISCETLDYACFKQQLSSQPIAGIERWYNSWRSMTATDEAGLTALRNQVFADIFDRPGKGYRKQLAGYAAYVAQVDHLIHPPADETPMEAPAMDSMETLSDSAAGVYATNPEQPDENNNSEKQHTMIVYLALGIGLFACILAALPLFRKREPQADLDGLPERLDELALRMKRLERHAADAQVNDAIASLTTIMESVEKRVVALENRRDSDRD